LAGDIMRSSAKDIRLIARADDMGCLHSCNLAVAKAFKEGILTCAAILAPAPWAREAAEMARANPSWCIGVHLAVIGEWKGYPWRPVLPYSQVSSITDDDGFFYRSPREFFENKPDFSEVKKELKAQVDLLVKWGVDPCYLDAHYIGDGERTGAENEFIEAVKELSEECVLPVSGLSGERLVAGVYTIPPAAKEDALAKQLGELTPGLWLLVNHLLVESPESQALVHTEPSHVMPEGVGNHRFAELKCITSPKIKEMINRKKIKLVNYRTFRKD
jgi:predicted glycoside hydrolase/deacetylase ChbG (UPF0249 family)